MADRNTDLAQSLFGLFNERYRASNEVPPRVEALVNEPPLPPKPKLTIEQQNMLEDTQTPKNAVNAIMKDFLTNLFGVDNYRMFIAVKPLLEFIRFLLPNAKLSENHQAVVEKYRKLGDQLGIRTELDSLIASRTPKSVAPQTPKGADQYAKMVGAIEQNLSTVIEYAIKSDNGVPTDWFNTSLPNKNRELQTISPKTTFANAFEGLSAEEVGGIIKGRKEYKYKKGSKETTETFSNLVHQGYFGDQVAMATKALLNEQLQGTSVK